MLLALFWELVWLNKLVGWLTLSVVEVKHD